MPKLKPCLGQRVAWRGDGYARSTATPGLFPRLYRQSDADLACPTGCQIVRPVSSTSSRSLRFHANESASAVPAGELPFVRMNRGMGSNQAEFSRADEATC
jgi:hypothetical protein